MMKILLEIGTEDLPARFLHRTILELKELSEKVLKENAIRFSTVKTYGTPRRLSLIVEEMAEYQETRTVEHFGPPKNVAFDKNGKPTMAAEGFARTHGINTESLIIKKKGKGEYVVAIIEKKGLPVEDLLETIFTKIITTLQFPKSMRWGNGTLRFARPIRWMTSLCGDKPVCFELDGIKSSNRTYGHRLLSGREILIHDIDKYIDVLRDNYVVLNHKERKELIKNQIAHMAKSLHSVVIEDEELLETVKFLVGYAQAVAGGFDEDFLRLPKELLVSVMRDHQKHFAFQDHDGNLVNHFVVVSNTLKENASIVKTGAERVIRARFEDAKFYYEEDIKAPLIERVEELKKIIFQEGLGTMYDKVNRLIAIGDFLRRRLFLTQAETLSFEIPEIEKLHRAVRLSKTDLITGVVREFPDLQGIIGKYYALQNGEDKEVAESIEEQYLPAYSEDHIPSTSLGTILSLADKLDNIVSFFSMGLIPTGSEDPFALRRQAAGIVSVLKKRDFIVSLDELFSGVIGAIKGEVSIKEAILSFFRQRLEYLLSSMEYTNDLIQAAMHNFTEIPPVFITHRIKSLKDLKTHDDYNEFLFAMKRVHNIIPGSFQGEVNKTMLATEHEKHLLGLIDQLRGSLYPFLDRGDYQSALDSLKRLTKPINEFFNHVLVMDKDDRIKQNRLAILKELDDVSIKVADFSKLAER